MSQKILFACLIKPALIAALTLLASATAQAQLIDENEGDECILGFQDTMESDLDICTWERNLFNYPLHQVNISFESSLINLSATSLNYFINFKDTQNLPALTQFKLLELSDQNREFNNVIYTVYATKNVAALSRNNSNREPDSFSLRLIWENGIGQSGTLPVNGSIIVNADTVYELDIEWFQGTNNANLSRGGSVLFRVHNSAQFSEFTESSLNFGTAPIRPLLLEGVLEINSADPLSANSGSIDIIPRPL